MVNSMSPINGLLGASHYLFKPLLYYCWLDYCDTETESKQHSFHNNELKMSVKWRSFYFGLIVFSGIQIYHRSGIYEIKNNTIHVII